MIRLAYISFFLLGFCHMLLAQQDALFTQFAFNKIPFNTAAAGQDSSAFVSTGHRNQWSGLQGAPKSLFFNYADQDAHNLYAWGGTVNRMSIGIQERYELRAFLSHTPAFLNKNLTFSAEFSARRFALDYTREDLLALDGFAQDPTIDRMLVTSSDYNVGASLFYSSNGFFAGISIPNLLVNNLRSGDLNLNNILERHLYMMLGAEVELSEDWRYKPEVLLKFNQNSPFNLDIVSLFEYRGRLSTGLNIRSGGNQDIQLSSVSYILGLQLNDQLFACMSYDLTVSELNRVENGSLEFLLRYNLKRNKKQANLLVIEQDTLPTTQVVFTEDSNNNINVSDTLGQLSVTENTTQSVFDSQKLLDGLTVIFEKIYYDYNSFNIDVTASSELDALAEFMIDNTEVKIKLTAHTDVRGDEEYNMWLSRKRAESAKNYLAGKGISRDRITVQGKGETTIRNHCWNGVKCSEEEHRYNRRTEVQLIGTSK